jgi:Protein of unknown function (DUF3365)
LKITKGAKPACTFTHLLIYMMRLRVSFVAVLLLAFFYGVACKPKKLENGRAIAEEVERRTVKRFTEKQILAEAVRVGDSLTHLADSLAQHRLTTSLRQGGIGEALKHYPPEAYAEVQAFARQYGAKPVRRGRQNPPGSERGQARMLNNTELLYTRAIYLRQTCLPCHGKALAQADAGELKKEKPLWAPRGLEVGDRAGTWFIPIRRKAILDGLTLKGMKKKPSRG